MQNTSNTSNTQTTQSSSSTSTFNLLPKTIVISNTILQSQLSKQAKIAYIALKYSLHAPVSYICTDELAIPFLPSEPNDIPSKLITILQEGLQELHDNNFIQIKKNIKNRIYLIDATDIFTNTSNFTVINTQDIQTIVDLELSKWYNYIIFYCIIATLINKHTKACCIGIVALKKFCGMSHDTITKTAQKLNKNNLIYIIKDELPNQFLFIRYYISSQIKDLSPEFFEENKPADLISKLNSLKTKSDKPYSVYMHKLAKPLSIYIGQTCVIPKDRWGHEGNGYKDNVEFYSAIKEYGWNNFEHIILYNNLTKQEADKIEARLIKKYKNDKNYICYNIKDGNIK